ncbi:MAG TPA: hypothetical protein VIL20_01650 [Sandaracinaceae bacterium]
MRDAASAAHRYAPFYCEENVWWLAQEPRLAGLPREVVMVSNEARAVACFAQRAAPSEGAPVVWDYHVVLAVRRPEGVEVEDLDCTRGFPLEAGDWLEATFGPARALPPRYAPRFRVIDADAYVSLFSSDRAHMRAPDGGWLAPEPPWPAIVRGPSNLLRLADVTDPFVGELLDLTGLRARWLGDQ